MHTYDEWVFIEVFDDCKALQETNQCKSQKKYHFNQVFCFHFNTLQPYMSDMLCITLFKRSAHFLIAKLHIGN